MLSALIVGADVVMIAPAVKLRVGHDEPNNARSAGPGATILDLLT